MFAAAARLSAAAQPFVLITVIDTKGSTPRDPGAKMIWSPRAAGGAGEFIGTVGGGQFELLIADAAARVFATRSTALEHFILGAEAEQCCGGAMDVFLEYCGSRHRLVVFGAGHVSRELADVLRGSPLEVVIVDDRAEWNASDRFGAGVRRIADWSEGVRAAREKPAESIALVMTCSHQTDFDLLRSLLRGDAPDRPAFVGLIGSRSKRVCLFGRLVASGIAEDVVTRVHCPIGVGDTGKQPRMVAVSIAAQALVEARRLESASARSGRPAAPVNA